MAKGKSRTYIVDLEVKGGKEAEAQISSINDELSELNDQAGDGSGLFDELGGSFGNVSGRAKGVIGSIKGISKGLGTLRGAIIATGIGAFIIALSSVSTWFNSTVEGSERLRKASSKLGGAWDEVKIKLAAAGETIVNAIDNPSEAWDRFKGKIDTGVKVIKNLLTLWINDWKIKAAAFEKGVLQMRLKWNEFTGDSEEAEQISEAIKKVNEEIVALQKETIQAQVEIAVEATKQINEFQRELDEAAERSKLREEIINSTIALEKRERALTVEMANRRAEIERLKFTAEDLSKSEDERAAAAQTAFALENDLMKERESLQLERIRLTRLEMETSLTSNEDLDELAAQEAELANIRQESTTRQIELNNKLNSIEAERQRKRQEADAEYVRIQDEMEEVRLALITEGVDRELAEIDRKYEELFLKANNNAELERQLVQAQQDEITAIEKRAADEREATAQQEQEAKVALAKKTVGGITALAEALADGDGKRAKAAFDVSKGLRIAEASANTYTAVTAALADPAPGRIIRAISAGAMGLAQVLKIKNTKFNSTGGGSGGGSIQAPSASSSVQNTAPTPQIDFSFLDQTPPQAYVLSGNVNSSLEAEQKLQDQATL